MSDKIDRKVFLTCFPDPLRHKHFDSLIKRHVSNPTISTANDGIEALSKANNDPPDVIITDFELPKMTGSIVIDHILKDRNMKAVSVIIAAHPPIQEQYIDEIVTGRIQFLETQAGEDISVKCLYKALNYASHQAPAEFYLRYLAKDDLLLKEGDVANCVYIVKKGELRAFRERDGKQATLGVINTGEFVGEMSYINGEPRSASVDAQTDCELIEVPMGTLERLLYQRPSWSKTLMHTLSKRLKRVNEDKTKNS